MSTEPKTTSRVLIDTAAGINRITSTHDLGKCPACDKQLDGALTIQVETIRPDPTPEAPSQHSIAGKVIGMEIRHNCTPQVPRERVYAGPLLGYVGASS